MIIKNLEGLSLATGICNEGRNVVPLIPHPESACEPLLGSDNSQWIFESIFAALQNKLATKAA